MYPSDDEEAEEEDDLPAGEDEDVDALPAPGSRSLIPTSMSLQDKQWPVAICLVLPDSGKRCLKLLAQRPIVKSVLTAGITAIVELCYFSRGPFIPIAYGYRVPRKLLMKVAGDLAKDHPNIGYEDFAQRVSKDSEYGILVARLVSLTLVSALDSF